MMTEEPTTSAEREALAARAEALASAARAAAILVEYMGASSSKQVARKVEELLRRATLRRAVDGFVAAPFDVPHGFRLAAAAASPAAAAGDFSAVRDGLRRMLGAMSDSFGVPTSEHLAKLASDAGARAFPSEYWESLCARGFALLAADAFERLGRAEEAREMRVLSNVVKLEVQRRLRGAAWRELRRLYLLGRAIRAEEAASSVSGAEGELDARAVEMLADALDAASGPELRARFAEEARDVARALVAERALAELEEVEE